MQTNIKNKQPKLEYSVVEFSLANSTSSPININLFDTNSLLNIPTQPNKASLALYISGSTDYNLFTRDILANPKKIDRIMIYGQSNTNLVNNLTINKVDATGDSCAYPILPLTIVSSNQFQGQIAQLDVKDFVLDVTTNINYTIPKNTTVKWVIYYKEYVKSDMLAGRVMISEFDSMLVSNPDTYDEKYLTDTALGNKWSESIELKKIITK